MELVTAEREEAGVEELLRFLLLERTDALRDLLLRKLVSGEEDSNGEEE